LLITSLKRCQGVEGPVPATYQQAMSKSPFWMADWVCACWGKFVAASTPMAWRFLATISSAAFQSVQPCGVISFHGPSFWPSLA
jgi:hypothetical protein